MKRSFKWLSVCMFLMICFTAGMLYGLGGGNAEEAWPPEGKKEGKSNWTGEELSGLYICNYEQAENYKASDDLKDFMLNQGEPFDFDTAEEIINSRLTLLSGSETVGNAFKMDRQGMMRFDLGKLQAGGEEATFRADLESEHFYASVEFTVKLVDLQDIEVRLDADAFTAAVGTPWDATGVLYGDVLHISPEMEYFGSLRNESGKIGENVGTEQYSIRNGYEFTASEEGQYPLELYVIFAKNYLVVSYPVTMNVVSQEEAQKNQTAEQIPFDADEASTAEDQGGGEAFEEVPGDAGSASGEKLKLELSQKDTEITILAGKSDQFLGYWNINDYEQLKAAWGGEPGWSIRPAEGSDDAIRWYNDHTQREGMRITAFEYTPAAEGDYASILTCTWNGQTVSARIDLHVLPSPIEPEYTVRLGETVKIDLHPYPSGWTAGAGTIRMSVLNITSVLDGQSTLENNGNPYFNIQYTSGADPVIIKPLKSGVYELEFYIWPVAYNYVSIKAGTRITVQNEDGTVPQSADEIQEAEGPQFSYNLETGWKRTEYAVITGGKAQQKITIPAEIDGYPVRMIDEKFGNSKEIQEKMETLVLEEGITRIDRNAFRNCSALKEVFLPESLISIGNGAFENCSSLQEIHFPSGLTVASIGDGAFFGIGLKDVVLPDGTSLAEVTAAGCADLISTRSGEWNYQRLADGTAMLTEAVGVDYETKEVTVPGEIDGLKVSALKDYILSSKSSLERVQLPEGLTRIGKGAFMYCRNLKEVNLPESLTYIGNRAFVFVAAEGLQLPEGAKALSGELWYAGLSREDSSGKWKYSLLSDGTAAIIGYTVVGKTLEIPSQVDGIPVTVISQLETLDWNTAQEVTKVKLPEGLTAIGERALQNMENLKQADLPGSLTRIGEYAFYDTGIKEINIPEGVVSIEENAFAACGKLKTVKLPSTLRTIEKEAFSNCDLTSVELPEGLETIEEKAFYAHKMTKLEIPASVKRIGNAAFDSEEDETLKEVTFRSPLTELGKGVFGYDTGYSEFTRTHQKELIRSRKEYNDQNPLVWKDHYADRISRKVKTIKVNCYPGSTADLLYQYNVKKNYLAWGPEGARTAPADTVLKAGLYQPEDMVYELTIPEGVEEIEEGALAGLKTLNRVTLPSTLKRIGARAFEDCGGLSEVSLPKGVAEIGEACFRNCVSLTKINLPEGMTEIPDNAFWNCRTLAKVQLPKSGLKRIGAGAFVDCDLLTDVKMPKGLEEIGDHAFAGSGLKKATVPDSVTKLGKEAFAMSDISSLTLPKGLTEIPEKLCYRAIDLKTVKIPGGVTQIGDRAFMGCLISNLTLPEGLTSIGESAFELNSEMVQMAYAYSGGKKSYGELKKLKLPASLRSLGKNAFACNDALTSVSFGKNAQIEEIGEQAFALCAHLKEIALPDSVKKIGDQAFINCPALKKADLGGAVTEVGARAFKFDKALESLTVPDTLTAIGEGMLDEHGPKLTVTCGQGSAMETWLKTNMPDVAVAYPKSKGK